MVKNGSLNDRELKPFLFLSDRSTFSPCQISFDMVQTENNNAIKDENNYYQW